MILIMKKLIKSKDEEENKINILYNKVQFIQNVKGLEEYYKKKNINPSKEFNYFNENNTKLYLNDEEIAFKIKKKLYLNQT